MGNNPSDFNNDLIRKFGQDFTGVKGETYAPSDDAHNVAAETEIERRRSAKEYAARQAAVLEAEPWEEDDEDDFEMGEDEQFGEDEESYNIIPDEDVSSSYLEDTDGDYNGEND